MREQKTPLKESSISRSPSLNRRPKPAEAPPKKPAQVPKKASGGEGTSRKSIDLSSVSEISDVNRDDETAEIVMQAFDPSPSVGSVSPDLSCSSEITGDDGSFLLETCDSNKPGNSKIGFLDAKVSANLLTATRAQVLKSLDVNRQSVKLLERAIANQVDGLHNPPGKRTYSGELASLNIHLFFFSLLLWILAMSVFFFFSADSRSMSYGPLPT
ncbi:uncharacterized protein LOC115691978 isoform X1 [Syzygium oleosum]|uniref:uncharacterized protein LOC115691978 isoform X1 n=1 Tax=Syzygium oleosum TaxID=219896 RepID=UPI0011D29CE2|nr:uncharacterized protein LOC115691978 isoform X1 [Syzygium oleosum]